MARPWQEMRVVEKGIHIKKNLVSANQSKDRNTCTPALIPQCKYQRVCLPHHPSVTVWQVFKATGELRPEYGPEMTQHWLAFTQVKTLDCYLQTICCNNLQQLTSSLTFSSVHLSFTFPDSRHTKQFLHLFQTPTLHLSGAWNY